MKQQKFKPLVKGVTAETIANAWREFKEAIAQETEALLKAGEKVAWLLDNDPDARQKFREIGISGHQVARLERIGRGRILPELAAKTTLFDHLPVKDQRRVLTEKVPAVFLKKNGAYEVRKVNVLAEDSITQNRVTGDTGIRTVEEQKAYIESFGKAAATTNAAQSWRINVRTKRIIFLCNSSYTLEQITQILLEFKNAIKE